MSATDCLARAKAAANLAARALPPGETATVTVVVGGRSVTLEARGDGKARVVPDPVRADPQTPRLTSQNRYGQGMTGNRLRQVLKDQALGLSVHECWEFWPDGRRPLTSEIEGVRKRAMEHAADAMTRAAVCYRQGEYERAALFIDKAARKIGG